MRITVLRLAASLLSLSLSSCYVASFFVPISKSPADHAHDFDKKCSAFSDPGSLSALIPYSAIDSVETAYHHVVDPPADHLCGAKIHVRPLPGMSKESLTRLLECHEASVVLGKSPALGDDPYTLPKGWVDIDVDSEGDAFLVLVRNDEFNDAQKVLARAKSYLAATRQPAPPASAAANASPTPPAAATSTTASTGAVSAPASPAGASSSPLSPATVAPPPTLPSPPAPAPASSAVVVHQST